MRKFIVIECAPLGDQYECDADRAIKNKIFTEEEIKSLTVPVGYTSGFACGDLDFLDCKTLTQAKAWFNKNYSKICKYAHKKRTFEDFIYPVYKESIEVYEILDNGNIIPCKEYTTYTP